MSGNSEGTGGPKIDFDKYPDADTRNLWDAMSDIEVIDYLRESLNEVNEQLIILGHKELKTSFLIIDYPTGSVGKLKKHYQITCKIERLKTYRIGSIHTNDPLPNPKPEE